MAAKGRQIDAAKEKRRGENAAVGNAVVKHRGYGDAMEGNPSRQGFGKRRGGNAKGGGAGGNALGEMPSGEVEEMREEKRRGDHV